MVDNSDSLSKLTEILSKAPTINLESINRPCPSGHSGRLKKAWESDCKKDLFEKKGLTPDRLPTRSLLILGDSGIGKSVLTGLWQEKLRFEIDNLNFDKYALLAEGRTSDFINGLRERSFYFIKESDIRKIYNDINSDKDELLYKIAEYKDNHYVCKWKYLFIDDIFEKESYPHSGKQQDGEFLLFMKSLFEILIESHRTIVIATTNNKPSDILVKPGEDKAKNKFLRRVKDIFEMVDLIEYKGVK